MKILLICLLIAITSQSVIGQSTTQFDPENRTVKIPFKFINNLIFIDVEVNNVPLKFLLDTGVRETILFSLDDVVDISFSNVETINLRGLGAESHVESYKSANNKIKIGGLQAINQEVFIILDQSFNFSSHIGIPVNGIVGYHFFKDNLVEIDYDRKRISISRNNPKHLKKVEQGHIKIPVTIETDKPYISTIVNQNSEDHIAKVLIDSGNSDAVWLFDSRSKEIEVPVLNFDDFLGYGFSGEIHGKRARVPSFTIGTYNFDNPIVAFPDSTSIKNIQMVADRVGSVGGEILKRFNVALDYKNEILYLKKGSRFDDAFRYDMSGIRLQHDGLQWIQKQIQPNATEINLTYDSSGNRKRSTKYKFELKPVFRITEIRANSPAEKAGICVGDVLSSLNGKAAFRYSLQQIDDIFKSEEHRNIVVEVEREDKILKFEFQLKSLL